MLSCPGTDKRFTLHISPNLLINFIRTMSEELFTLSSYEFGNRCKETFSKLWLDKDFTDVTLATDDGCKIAVHRIVLASSSSLFKRLLSNSPHSQDIVVLQGISMKRLELVLEYVYQGQCDIGQRISTLFSPLEGSLAFMT